MIGIKGFFSEVYKYGEIRSPCWCSTALAYWRIKFRVRIQVNHAMQPRFLVRTFVEALRVRMMNPYPIAPPPFKYSSQLDR